MQRRAAELAGRRARRANEDYDDADSEFESDDNYHEDNDDSDDKSRRDYDYREQGRRDLPDAVIFRREQDDLEIAHMEMAVVEATRSLEDAKRNLRQTKLRIKNRRREERQQLEEQSRKNRSVPELSRAVVDDGHARVGALSSGDIICDADQIFDQTSQQAIRDYLTPAGNRSCPPTPQPFSLNLPTRSRSPSPYRFSSRTQSRSPIQRSQSSQPVHGHRPRSHTPNRTAHIEREDDDAIPAAQEQVYQSFTKLHDVAKEFQTLKQNFVYPPVIEFQKPGSQLGEVITVRALAGFEHDELMLDSTGYDETHGSEGKLAYTRANEALHAYTYAMEKLLGKLDSVDSWNETSVRTKRRGIVGDIEQEASKLERYKRKVWCDYVTQENIRMYR